MTSKNLHIETQWNVVFEQFLDQMINLFPESPAHSVKLQYYVGKTIGNKKPIVFFLEHIQEHGEEVLNKNEKYFFEANIPFVEKLELKKYYSLSNSENKDVIWQYIIGLYLLATNYNV